MGANIQSIIFCFQKFGNIKNYSYICAQKLVMKVTFMKRIPRGIPCLLILTAIFGYMASVMGVDNMLNTIMRTAHDLLLNTVFYLMGMCVMTGALGKILIKFGVVDLLQRLLRPAMQRLFNMPGIASMVAVVTFLSDRPAIIGLAKDPALRQHFTPWQHASIVNFGGAFSMGMLVVIFMLGQGYVLEPFVGLLGAVCGCICMTRLMQHVARPVLEHSHRPKKEVKPVSEEGTKSNSESEDNDADELPSSTFISVLNALLDGGREGVAIGLAVIPGVLIISTFVMMLTFGGSHEGIDAVGNEIIVYTGGAYQGTQLLPWLAGKVGFLFRWLFGFSSPEVIAFPITALGAVGAALGLIPEFAAKGIVDGNAIAVCTAMGMCWSGFLSTDAAILDSIGYRMLVVKSFLCTLAGGICAGISAHWIYMSIIWIKTLTLPDVLWQTEVQAWNDSSDESISATLIAYDDGTYKIQNWYGVEGSDLAFRVNMPDSTITILNAYAEQDKEYFFVQINPEAEAGKTCYAAIYPVNMFSQFNGDEKSGSMYCFAFIYDKNRKLLNRCYYELTWGGYHRQTFEAEKEIDAQKEAERAAHEFIDETLPSDSIQSIDIVK